MQEGESARKMQEGGNASEVHEGESAREVWGLTIGTNALKQATWQLGFVLSRSRRMSGLPLLRYLCHSCLALPCPCRG